MSSENMLEEEIKIEEVPMSKRRRWAHRIAMIAFFSLFCFVLFLGFYWSRGASEVTHFNCGYCDETTTEGEWFYFDDPQIEKPRLIMRLYGYTDPDGKEYKFPTTRYGENGKVEVYICQNCIKQNNLTVEEKTDE